MVSSSLAFWGGGRRERRQSICTSVCEMRFLQVVVYSVFHGPSNQRFYSWAKILAVFLLFLNKSSTHFST